MEKIKYILKRLTEMNFKNMFTKIKEIHKKTKKNSLFIFFDMGICALKYGAGYMDYDLFEMYNLKGKERNTYITRGRNNDLIKKYNNSDYNYYFRDKAVFNETFKEYIKRDFIVLCDANKKDVIDFMKKHKTFMVKPLMGTCGKGIEKINTKDYSSLETLYQHLVKTNLNVELEEVIMQAKEVSNIYPNSINTVRIVTILDDDNVPHIICAYFRIGNGNKWVDNFNSGGMVAPVDEKKGIVLDKAIDKQKNLYAYHPLTNAQIKGFKFPDWDEALKLVKKATHVVPFMRYIGWDVAFTPNGPILVEGNEYPGHDIYQLPEHTPNKTGIWPKFTKAFKSDKKSVKKCN